MTKKEFNELHKKVQLLRKEVKFASNELDKNHSYENYCNFEKAYNSYMCAFSKYSEELKRRYEKMSDDNPQLFDLLQQITEIRKNGEEF